MLHDYFPIALVLAVYVPVWCCARPLVRWSRATPDPFGSPARSLVLGPLAAIGAVLLLASVTTPALRAVVALLLARALWQQCRRV